jgi:hypothetical protein
LSTFALKAQPTPSYQVKAAFLYNFSQFVEWPRNSFNGRSAPFVIGILGQDPFGSYLKELVEGEKAGDRRIIIKKFSSIAEVSDCHILFVNIPDGAEAIKALRFKSILTVSDEQNFARNGGMVRFFTDNNKIRLQINIAAARAANLTISAKLLRVAEIVER